MDSIGTERLQDVISAAAEALSDPSSTVGHCIRRRDESVTFPDARSVDSIIEYCRALIFPGFFSDRDPRSAAFNFGIGIHVAKLHALLVTEIRACDNLLPDASPERCDTVDAESTALHFIEMLPQLRDALLLDLDAIYRGDPAATSYAEIIYSYPAIRAIANHRIANTLHRLGVRILPRMIAEHAHRETGIDIHPAATIGQSFMIDHGTGVVIGETAVIGNRCRIYQGVTLGAKSFPTEDDGTLVKSIARHPIIGDDVVIYANTTILGRITIGNRCTIGGNLWITESIADDTTVVQARAENSIIKSNPNIPAENDEK